MILCFEWNIGKIEDGRIFKHYKTLMLEGKKERNHFNLKQIENIKTLKIARAAWRNNL